MTSSVQYRPFWRTNGAYWIKTVRLKLQNEVDTKPTCCQCSMQVLRKHTPRHRMETINFFYRGRVWTILEAWGFGEELIMKTSLAVATTFSERKNDHHTAWDPVTCLRQVEVRARTYVQAQHRTSVPMKVPTPWWWFLSAPSRRARCKLHEWLQLYIVLATSSIRWSHEKLSMRTIPAPPHQYSLWAPPLYFSLRTA